jgi:hypothetical protein
LVSTAYFVDVRWKQAANNWVLSEKSDTKLQAVVSAKYQVIKCTRTIRTNHPTPLPILTPAPEEENMTLKDDENVVYSSPEFL